MLLLAAITLTLNLDKVFQRAEKPPETTCGIQTVSYRFVGEPGTEFRYAGEKFQVPVRGVIELIAERGVTEYQVASRKLPLDVWPRDEMGTRTVPLPKAGAIPEIDSASQEGASR